MNAHCNFICNSQKLVISQMFIGECINKLWHIHTIKYYSAVRRNLYNKYFLYNKKFDLYNNKDKSQNN